MASQHYSDQQESVQEKEEFLARISHEIRTPLNAIIGYAEMLGKTRLDGRQKQYADNIIKSGLVLVDILNTWAGQEKNIDDAVPKNAEQAGPQTVQDGAPFKILVAEDSVLIRDLFQDIFSETHFLVYTADNAVQTIELAQTERPQLIFIDLHLSGSDGWQVARELRGNIQTAAIPLIVMTGQVLTQEEYRRYFDEFLQKPFQLKTLRGMVESWEKRLVREAACEPAAPDLAQCVAPHWSEEMGLLLSAIVHTGSLPVSLQLGNCMEEAGRLRNCAAMREAGRQLIRCAAAPDIAGVDAVIEQLSPLLK